MGGFSAASYNISDRLVLWLCVQLVCICKYVSCICCIVRVRTVRNFKKKEKKKKQNVIPNVFVRVNRKRQAQAIPRADNEEEYMQSESEKGRQWGERWKERERDRDRARETCSIITMYAAPNLSTKL